MLEFMTFVVIGLTTGAIYSIAATGLVLTFTTSRIFNLAHGAVGMFLVFVYYQLRVEWGLPEILSLVLTVLVLGPLFGVALGQFMMQRLAKASVAIRLTGTLALFVVLDGVTQLIWGNGYRGLPGLISDDTFAVLNVRISYNQLATVVIALVVAGALWAFLHRTRLGTAMRAVVDDSDLAQLTAISPNRVQNVSWAIGSSLAGLAAILIAPNVSLNIPVLSLLIVSAFAAAIIGGLASIGWTYAGGLALGIVSSLMTDYLPSGNEFLQGLPASLPFIVLFVALIVMRQERQSLQRVNSPIAEVPARLPSIVGWAVAFIAAAVLVAPHLPGFAALVVATGLVYASILLSLVLLTGMAGQVSLCQFSFVGIGAITVIHLSHYMPYPLAVLAAIGVTAVGGALIALPALRLRGLYVALATLAFAVMCDNLVFNNSHLLGSAGQAIAAPAPSLFGLTLAGPGNFVIAAACLTALFAVGIQLVRRGHFGRALTAMRDSPVAASALGMRLVRTKVLVFAISAAMAGLAGCLFAGLLGQVGGSEFTYLTSLTAVLILAIQGVTAVPGAVLGGAFYAIVFLLVPQWISNTVLVNAIQLIGVGLAVFGVLRNPEGAWPMQMRGITKSLEVGASQMVGLIGPNGAGKSTLISVLSGLRAPASGRVVFDGRDLRRAPAHARVRYGMTRTFQRLELWDSMSVYDNIRTAAEFAARSRSGFDVRQATGEAISVLGLEDVADSSTGALSTGTARLVEVARALASRPKLMLLDEPSAGLDNVESERLGHVLANVAAGGTSILLVEHHVDMVFQHCANVYVLDFGQVIASGSPHQIQRDEQVRRAYLGGLVDTTT